jgi:hypothetical protein
VRKETVKMEADFSGYATKAGLKCSDGRTIMAGAFKDMHGQKVPLVWQHSHNDPNNVLGHAILEARGGDIYAHAFLNEGDSAKSARTLVKHGDITALSIYANKLVEKGKDVFHGVIREVSLVLSGANPGAFIDNISLEHSDGSIETLENEAIIYTGIPLEKEEKEEVEAEVEHADGDDKSFQDVYDSLSDEQKDVVHFMIGAALEQATAEHSASTDDEGDLNHQEGNDDMTRNVFEQNDGPTVEKHELSHADVKGIVAGMIKGGSLKSAVEDYALAHGIENLEILFPDARSVTDTPEWDKRRTEWVAGVLNGTHHTPFSRIKSFSADITMDEARAKGYIKGNMKKEEFFGVAGRTTTPTTVYKKQSLDRDDIIDITSFGIVSWMKGEMRLILEEELARAVLIGDGREVDDEDKIKDPMGAPEGAGIRSIANDHELYVTTVNVNIGDANSSPSELVDAILSSRTFFKGSGTPTFYTTEETLTYMLLARDTLGRRLYKTTEELANELRVSSIVPVEVMETEPDLVGIIVNLTDYNIGADKGGEVNMFDDFDIDYNKNKYLIETRISGALIKLKSALVYKKTAGTNVLATPQEPAFDEASGTLTIPTVTGVVYKHGATTLTSAGNPHDVPAGTSWTVDAVAAAGYYFASSEDDSWTFTADA